MYKLQAQTPACGVCDVPQGQAVPFAIQNGNGTSRSAKSQTVNGYGLRQPAVAPVFMDGTGVWFWLSGDR